METWKEIPAHPNYEVSNYGRVRSWAKRGGYGGRACTSRPIKPQPGERGHMRVQLTHRKRELLHRLVLEAFVGPCPDGMEGCHNDGDPGNNMVENLRWDTRANNHADKVQHGTWQGGENHGLAKLTEQDVKAIREAYGPPRGRGARDLFLPSMQTLADQYGVDRKTIAHVIHEKNWSHIR